MCSLGAFSNASARVLQQVQQQMQRLSLNRRAFCKGLAEATALNNAQTMYQIDVGGVSFHTQTEVLHEGMLAAMSSENFSNNLDHMFLDRDPTWFPLVLHFLRTGDALLPECTEERRAVFREAQYYSLHGLCQAARKRPERIIVIGERYDGDYDDDGDDELLCEMFKPLHGSWEPIHVGAPAWGIPYNCNYSPGDAFLFVVKPRYHGSVQHDGSVCRFCPATCSWVDISSSNPLTSHACSWAYHKGHLYGAAGTCLQSLDVSTGQWEELPTQRSISQVHISYASLCVVDDQLFVVGGLQASTLSSHREYRNATASVETYLISERRWVSVPNMPTAVVGAAAVGLDGKLLVIGGIDICGDVVSTVLEYNPADQQWKRLPSLLLARTECTVTVLGGHVVVIGGYSWGEPLSSVERYNSRLHRWEAMHSLTDRLRCSAAVVIQSPP